MLNRGKFSYQFVEQIHLPHRSLQPWLISRPASPWLDICHKPQDAASLPVLLLLLHGLCADTAKHLLKQQSYRSGLHKCTLFPLSKSAQLSCKSLFKCPSCSTSTVPESFIKIPLEEIKRYVQLKSSLENWQCQGTGATLLVLICNSLVLQEKALRAFNSCLFAVTPCFPRAGQAAKQVQQAPLAAAGVPSLMPRLLKQRERGARHGKGSEGAGRELILEISRKETKCLNALLAEIPSKREETEPSSGTSPSISGCSTHQPEGINCWPTSTKHTSDCEGYCKQPGHDRLLLGCRYCFCSCPYFVNQHPLLCFFTFKYCSSKPNATAQKQSKQQYLHV